MVVVKLGVVKLVPIPIVPPPVEAEYQLMVPALAVAPKLTVPLPQCMPSIVPVMVGIGLMVAVTADLVAVVQPLFVAST